jgi:hypothetical protein
LAFVRDHQSSRYTNQTEHKSEGLSSRVVLQRLLIHLEAVGLFALGITHYPFGPIFNRLVVSIEYLWRRKGARERRCFADGCSDFLFRCWILYTDCIGEILGGDLYR